MRDTLVSRPRALVDMFLPQDHACRLVLVWDLHGCGQGDRSATDVEKGVADELRAAGLQDSRFAVACISPESEALFAPVWERIKEHLARRRNMPVPPTDAEIISRARALQRRQTSPCHIPDDLRTAMDQCPKELFEALVALLNLRRSPALYEDIGDKVSIPQVKENRVAAYLAARLEEWFPPKTVGPGGAKGV